MSNARRALIVGINHYQNAPSLTGCVPDAVEMHRLLSSNEDGSPNFDCLVMTAENAGSAISRVDLKRALQRLFSADLKGQTLFYFSGHGAIEPAGGYLATSDAEEDDVGVAMAELIELANQSSASDICLILDCCHSGQLGNMGLGGGANPFTLMREGTTIIAASGASQVALEEGGHGVFTGAVIEALSGGAIDYMGWVTPPSIYSYVERRFNAWGQKPVYKTHTSELTVVRKCAPLIAPEDLRKLVTYFPKPDASFTLDPEYEPEDEHGNVAGPINVEKVATAQLFKRYRDAGLLRPVEPGEQLYWTGRRGHDVALTARGKEQLALVKQGRI
jgi:hypothetical protein